jgi:hypothetical protein
MKTLTITQPWATLVAIGAKRIETRSWSTSYRGQLAIHAAKGFPKWAQETCREEPFHGALRMAQIFCPALPLGAVVAVCRLVSCLPTRELQENRTIQMDPDAGCDDFHLTDHERAFGDYAPGRWAWLLADVRLITPVDARGALGLWNWEAE